MANAGDNKNSLSPAGPEKPEKDNELLHRLGLDRPTASKLSLQATQLGDSGALDAIKGKTQAKAAAGLDDLKQAAKPPAETTPATTLDREALLTKVVAIHDALNRKALWGIGWSSPDKDRVFRELDPLNQADRSALEKLYAEKYGSKDSNFYVLRSELKQKLGSEADARAVSMLNRIDGRTNDAGQLNTLLTKVDSAAKEKAGNNSLSFLHVASDIVVPGKFLYERYQNHSLEGDQAAAEKQIRETVAGLNSKQLTDLDRDYKAQFGKSFRDAILSDKNLSEDTRDALKIYLKNTDPAQNGIDKRTAQDQQDLAGIALKSKNLDMLGEALRGDSPAAAAARRNLLIDQGDEKLKAAFSGEDLTRARDFLKEGRIGLATIASEDTAHWYHKNKSHLEQSLADAGDKERADYAKGRELAQERKSPSNAEEKHQLDYYVSLHGALKKAASNERELSSFEDKLLRKGSIISDLTASHSDGWWITGIGKGHDTGDLLSKIETMKEEDWKRLKTDPAFRRDIDAALSSFASADERRRVDDLLDRKAKAETYDQSKAEERSIVSTIGDSTHHGWFGSTSYDKGKILDAVVSLSPDDQKKYRDDPKFKKEINDDLDKCFADGPEKNLARRLLAKVEAGKELKLDAIDKVLLDTAKGAKPDQTVRDIEAVFKQDSGLQRRLRNPQTAEDKETRSYLEGALTSAVFKSGMEPLAASKMYERYSTVLFEAGGLPLSMKLELATSKKDKLEDIISAPEGVRKGLLNPTTREETNLRTRVLQGFSKDERELIENGLKQGNFSLADRVRALTLDDGSSYQELREPLQQLRDHPDQLEALKNEYTRKYNRSLDDDLLSRVDEKDRSTYRNLLTPAKLDGRQDFYDGLAEHMKSRSGIGNSIMSAGLWDGTASDLDRALNENAALRGEYARKFEDLTPERQQQLVDLYSRALTSYRDSKGQMTEQLVDGALVVGSLAAAPLSGGASLTALTAIAAAGATFKIGATAALEGNDFKDNPKEIAKLGLQGAFMTGLALVGPAQVASVFKIGDAAAAEAVAGLGVKLGAGALRGAEGTILREGYEVVGKKALASLTREALVSGRDLAATDFARVASGLVREDLTATARQEAVKQVTTLLARQYNVALEQGERTLVHSMLQSGRALATETVSNAALGATASAASQVVTFPLDYDPRLGLSGNFNALAERMKQAGIAGAAGGAVFTGIFHLARPLPGLAKSGYRRLVGSGTEAGESVGITLGIKQGERIIAADPSNPRVEITHADGKTTTVKPGDTYTLKPGDEITGVSPEGQRPVQRPAREVTGEKDSISGPRSTQDRPTTGTAKEETLWNPQRDISKLTFEERQAVYEELGYNPSDLIYNDPIDAFIGSTLPKTARWTEDLSAAAAEVQALHEVYETAFRRYQDMTVEHLLGRVRLDDMIDRPLVQQALKDLVTEGKMAASGAEQRLALLDDLLRVRDPYQERFMKLDAAVEQRRAEFEEVINGFADSQGLPRARVRTQEDMGAADARYGDGVITIRQDALHNNNNTSRLIELGYHELVHHEQDTLIIRMAIDRVEQSLGTRLTSLTDAERIPIKKLYKQLTDGDVSQKHLDAVFASRKGLELTPSEITRAERLAEASRNNAPVGPQYVESGNHFKVTRRYLRSLRDPEDPNGAFKLIEKLRADQGKLSEHLFGVNIKSASELSGLSTEMQAQLQDVQRLMDIHRLVLKSGVDWPRRDAENVLTGLLRKRLADINESRQLAYDRYFAGIHEKEAWVVSERARLNSLMKGATANEAPARAGNSSDDLDGVRFFDSVGSSGRGMDSISFVDDAAGTTALTAKERINQLRTENNALLSYNREVVRAMDRSGGRSGDALQLDMFTIVRNQLRQLQEEGSIGAEWELYPTAIGSGADRVGADYLLVNSKTGEFKLLDPTTNPDKRNVAAMRADGVIQFEPSYVDRMGALRTDPEELPEIREAVALFQRDLTAQLRNLTSTPSLLNFHEAPFPSALPGSSPEAVQKDVERFVGWLKTKANEYPLSSPERALYNDYALVLERGAQKHAQVQSAKQPAPPQLAQIAQKASDMTVIDVAVRNVLRQGRETAPGAPKSEIVRNKQGELNLHVSQDLVYDLGSAESMLKNSRARLVDVKELSRLMPKGKWNALRAAYPNESEQRLLVRVRDAIFETGRLIGTRTSDNYYPLIDDLAIRLRSRSTDDLLQVPRPTPPAAKVTAGTDAVATAGPSIKPDAQVSDALRFTWKDMVGDVPLSADTQADLIPVMEMVLDDRVVNGAWTPAQIAQFRRLMSAYESGDGQAARLLGDILK